MWLRGEPPDIGPLPTVLRYGPEHAANIAQGIWEPKSSAELAAWVRELTQEEEAPRTEWEHVYRTHANMIMNWPTERWI